MTDKQNFNVGDLFYIAHINSDGSIILSMVGDNTKLLIAKDITEIVKNNPVFKQETIND